MTDPGGPETAPTSTFPSAVSTAGSGNDGPFGPASPDEQGPRPRPRVTSVVASVGGLLAFSGVVVLLANLPHSGTRFWGLLLSAVALALGGVAAWRWRGRPAASAGVALSALSVVPFFVFAFIDPKRPGRTFSTLGHAKNIITGILLLAALVWFVAYLRGPGRRFAFYLGAALASVWLVVLLQVGVKSGAPNYNSISRQSGSVVPARVTGNGGPAVRSGPAPAITDQFTDSSNSDSFNSDPFNSDPFNSDSFNSDSFNSDSFNSDSFNSDPFPFGSTSTGSFPFGRDFNDRNPIGSATTTGLLSFLIGAAYAFAGTKLDQRGEGRTGTPFFVVASAALPVGIVLMGTGSLHAKPAEVLAVLTGLAFLLVGTRGGRRFSSWYGGFGVLVGVSALVADIFKHHPVVAGLVLVVLGVAAAIAADLLSDRIEGPGGSGGRLRPFPETEGPNPSASGPATSGSAWPAEPWPAQPFPGAPPGAPPAAPPQVPPSAPSAAPPWGSAPADPPPAGPTFQPPPASLPPQPFPPPQPPAAPESS